jgi:hypothetical protein
MLGGNGFARRKLTQVTPNHSSDYNKGQVVAYSTDFLTACVSFA